MHIKQREVFVFGILLALVVFSQSCKKLVPVDREEIGMDSRFTEDTYEPVLGRTTVFSNNFFKGSTSFPVDFEIVHPRRFNGEPAPELTDTFPVTVWETAYTGEEESLQEIEEKRTTDYRRLWEVRPHSGQFVMWSAAKSAFMRAQPDSGYIFDVEMSSSGGRRYFRNMKLKPLRERPYEASNLDPVLGQGTTPGVHPNAVRSIKGVVSDRYLGPGDIDVFFQKVGEGNSLTFRFLDTLFQPIHPSSFDLTEWETLVHGFDMEMSDTGVTYKVAYPIPLTERPTRYTTADGEEAQVTFTFSRLGFGHVGENGSLTLNFRIFEKGDWQIIFSFINENPKFEDD